MGFYLPVRPGFADQIEQQTGGDFDDVEEAFEESDAGLSAAALVHAGGDFFNAEASTLEEEDDFGFGVVFGIPVGEGVDDALVGGAEAAGAVGDVFAGHGADEAAQDPAAEEAGDTLAVLAGFFKAGADDQVGVGVDEVVDEAKDFGGAVLAVAVNLDGDIVTVAGGVAVAGLHGPADAEVEGEADDGSTRGDLLDGVVGGAVVDDQDVKIREGAVQVADELADGFALVKDWHDGQAAKAFGMTSRRKLHALDIRPD
jgi:hypothetical protein